MKYTETRILRMSDLQHLCVRKNWYNEGSNEEYIEMLLNFKSGKNVTTADILCVAQNIAAHSSELSEHIKEDLENVCFELLEICNTFIEIEI